MRDVVRYIRDVLNIVHEVVHLMCCVAVEYIWYVWRVDLNVTAHVLYMVRNVMCVGLRGLKRHGRSAHGVSGMRVCVADGVMPICDSELSLDMLG